MVISCFDRAEYDEIKKSHPLFAKAFDAVEKLTLTDPSDGRYDVDGDNVFINVSTYETNPINSERRFEAHRDYIDIQLLLEGREIIGFAHPASLTVTDEYRPDYELFGMIDSFDKIILEKGKFAVIYPNEPHAPGLAAGMPEKVRKIVVKVKA